MLPLADRVVELVPHVASADRPPETAELTAGAVLFEQGTVGDLIYVVSEGELDIVRELASGGEELLRVATPGDYLARWVRCTACPGPPACGPAPMRP